MSENKAELYEISATLVRQAELFEKIADTPNRTGELTNEEVSAIRYHLAASEVSPTGVTISSLLLEVRSLNELVASLADAVAKSTVNPQTVESATAVKVVATKHEKDAWFIYNVHNGFALGDKESREIALKLKPNFIADLKREKG
ncbi:hypothetical protein QN355_11600 [Cryobacterium sp. 10S3]|uniref:hypothetical protein n=1 Tax=Cryobacterium sp. 10S3 TaxID=3048582 RepID=UPI002AC97048|nr:hypothetical protein [Cryobacterium sp. 10S3]MEB0287198.1 hypothetical protein [Cryobacterium sp. 10S3]WPX14153.1 hypothetical protein RHM57_01920 [Cryobacterium sp. 10S3]